MLTLFLSMLSFSLSMSISPGPANLTILNSAMNYGLGRTVAFISGATWGFTALLAAVCFGLYQILVIFPILLDVIAILGTLLLFWMGWKIASAQGAKIQTGEQQDEKNIPTFMQGVLLQWLNPKAWIAAVAGTALFSASQNSQHLIWFILIYFVVCYASLFFWGIMGEKLTRFLNTEQRAKIFNVLMGIILMFIAVHMCWQHFD